MIKRLKWNVLYGGGGGEESGDGLSSSEESEEGNDGSPSELLARLIENDADLQGRRRLPAKAIDLETATEDVSGVRSGVSGAEPTATDAAVADHTDEDHSGAEDSEEAAKESVAEEDSEWNAKVVPGVWQECELCPGKRFLNDGEVKSHLQSKGHARALRALARRELAMPRQGCEEAETPLTGASGQQDLALGGGRRDSGILDSDGEENTGGRIDRREDLKRKAAVKRKLQRLKRRKWERSVQQVEQQQMVATETAGGGVEGGEMKSGE